VNDGGRVAALITVVASAATGLFVLVVDGAWNVGAENPTGLLVFLLLSVGLQLTAVEMYGRGALSFSGMGMLATGYAFGVGAAVTAALVVAVVNIVNQQRGRIDRMIFNAANLSLSAAAGAGASRGALTPPARTASWGSPQAASAARSGSTPGSTSTSTIRPGCSA